MVLCSSRTGQAALQPLPTNAQQTFSSRIDIGNYPLPKNAVQSEASVDNKNNKKAKRAAQSEGIAVWKISKNGKLQARSLLFSADRRSLLLTSSRIRSIRNLFKTEGNFKKIGLSRIDRILKGRHTDRFRKAIHAVDEEEPNSNHHQPESDVLQQGRTISIIYQGESAFESIDLAVSEQHVFDHLFQSLTDLVKLHRDESDASSTALQLLQYHWLDMGHTLEPLEDGSLSLPDFLNLADRLDLMETLGTQKLTVLFKDYCQGLKRKTDHLTFGETARLFEKARLSQPSSVDDPLEQLWRQMVEQDPVAPVGVDDNASYASYELQTMDNKYDNDILEDSISTVAFLSFLRSEQKEFSLTLEQATELVNTLNYLHDPRSRSGNGRFQSRLPPSPSGKRTIAPNDRLTKSRFMDYIRSDFNDLLSPDTNVNMKRPLSHYFIASSHDTFQRIPTEINGAKHWENERPHSDEVCADSFYTALHRGVRCLEVAVWDSPDQMEPIIAFSEETKKGVAFRECLQAIGYFLTLEPSSFPILLKIENHCSNKVQSVMAQELDDYIGKLDWLYRPRQDLRDEQFVLPSPEEARGKVLILGKRPRGVPRKIPDGSKVIHDDYDVNNDDWELLASPSHIKYFDEEQESRENQGIVVGFDIDGPVYGDGVYVSSFSPVELLEKAERDRAESQVSAKNAQVRYGQLVEQAKRAESEALGMAQKVTLLEDTKPNPGAGSDSFKFVEEKSGKDDEGVEIHDVLSDILEASQQEYVKAALEAMESAKKAAKHKNALNRADEQLMLAKRNLDQSQENVDRLVVEAQKAKQKATSNREHADVAKVRLEQVHSLLKNCEETSTSAETVVVTALTEAKISEKRASDAEARASKAQANASKDRARSDEETQKEEQLEQKVTSLVTRCKDASRRVKEMRQRIDKLSLGADRVAEQIRLIENSSNYQTEVNSGTRPSGASKHGGSFVDKREAKRNEREALKQKIRESTEELKSAEEEKQRLQSDFEELNQVLRLQTELASKMRKVADRSAHVAEELAEHAEEEREAADLRHVARQRAEANVQNRGNHKESLQTQYSEAQRAASEAARLANESRKYADQLEKNLIEARDFTRLAQIVEERQWGRNEASAYYDQALNEKTAKDSEMLQKKKLVDVSDEVREATNRNSNVDLDKVKTRKSSHQGAIDLYTKSVVLSRMVDDAKLDVDETRKEAEGKAKVARRAREYKEKMDLVVEIPPKLAAQTLLHSLRHFHWDKSNSLSNAHFHSVPFHILHRMIEAQSEAQERGIRSFTQSHLCRVFPSLVDGKKNTVSNHDPVFPWSMGCQLVSMNYSNPSEELLVSEGMFRQSGSCGYVLKSPNLFGPRPETSLQRWSIKILGAYHLPKSYNRKSSRVHPVVRLTLHSGEKGALPFTFETSVRQGTNQGEVNTCTFDVGNEWLAMASFTVLDKSTEKSEFIAGAAVPVSSFREGYRSVVLFDANHGRTGSFKFASIVIHVSKLD